MSGEIEEEVSPFEVAVVVPKRCDCVEVLLQEFQRLGLLVQRVPGLQNDFFKLAVPMEALGRAATEMQMNKRIHTGIDLPFDWDKHDAFVRQPDGSLFSWWERYRCYEHIIYGIVNRSKSVLPLTSDGKDYFLDTGESLMRKLESEGVVKLVFPLHDEIKRKQLLRNWALNYWNFTNQPIDDIYLYFGTKVATYFAFLGMYTNWLLFPAWFALTLLLVDFGSWQTLMLPVFTICVISWAVLFFQFWQRKNSALLARWQISHTAGADPSYKYLDMERNSPRASVELMKKSGMDKAKKTIQKEEWAGRLIRFTNDAIIISSIICIQLPFELAFAHIAAFTESSLVKFSQTVIYVLFMWYFKKIAVKLSVKLVKHEKDESTEYIANSLIYKVFGIYFLQTYSGAFYLVPLHRNFETIRQILTQRLIVAEVLETLMENGIPHLVYNYKKYKAVRNKKKHDEGPSRVEREYMKPAYSATIGDEFEDGLFDDFLELTLKYGKIMMFACVYPLAFVFVVLSNVAEIKTDALKLLAVHKRPVPRAAASIGAWLNIFQFLTVMSICTNCALLVCLYDEEGEWNIEPGLAAILVVEHVLLLIKFGFSRLVPEEPEWVRAKHRRNAEIAHTICSQQLFSSATNPNPNPINKTE